MIASLSTAIPLAYVLQSGFEALEVKKVDLDIESFDAKKQFATEGQVHSLTEHESLERRRRAGVGQM